MAKKKGTPVAQVATLLEVPVRSLQRWAKRAGAPIRRDAAGHLVVDDVAALKTWASQQGLGGASGRPVGALNDPGGTPGINASSDAAQEPADEPEEVSAETVAAIEARVRGEVLAEVGGASAALREELARVELKKRQLDAERLEMNLAERKGTLMSREEVERGQLRRISDVKRELESLSSRFATKLVGLSASEIRATMDKEVRALLFCLADKALHW